MRRSIRYGQLFLLDVPPTPEAIRDCPALNPQLDLSHEVASMVARVLHPGHAGPLNNAVPGEPDLRHIAGITW